MNFPIPHEMLGHAISSVTTEARTFQRSQLRINPDNYQGDSVTWYLVVDAWNDHVSLPYSVTLVDSDGATIDSISIAAATGDSGYPKWHISDPLILNAYEDVYRIKLDQTAGAGDLGCRCARLVPFIVGATKVAIPVPLFLGNTVQSTDTGAAYSDQTTYGTQLPSANYRWGGWEYNASFYQGTIVEYEFEVNGYVTATTGYWSLHAMGGAQVASSELSSGNIVPSSLFKATLDEGQLSSGTHYEAQAKIAGSGQSYFCQAWVWVIITYPTALRIPFLVGADVKANISWIFVQYRMLYDTAQWSGDTIAAYLELTGRESTVGDVAGRAYRMDDAGPGYTGDTISGYDCDPGSTARAIYRSADLISQLVDGDWYCGRVQRTSTGAMDISTYFLVFALTGTGPTPLAEDLSEILEEILDEISYDLGEYEERSIDDGLEAPTDGVGDPLEAQMDSRNLVATLAVTPAVGDLFYLADIGVRHPDRFYEPRVKSWGSFLRSIPSPAGLIRLGDGQVVCDDADQYLKKRAAPKTLKKAEVELRLGPEGTPHTAHYRVLISQIYDIQAQADIQTSLMLRDAIFDFLDTYVDPIITPELFPALPQGAASNLFAPLVIGAISTMGRGAIEAPYVDTALHRYFAARHSLGDLSEVFRETGIDGEEELVNPSEYSIVEDPSIRGFADTFIQFSAEQDPKYKITFNVDEGIVDEEGNPLVLNFADTILAVFRTFPEEFPPFRVNWASFDDVRDKLEAEGYVCQGAWVKPITFRAALTQLCKSCNCQIVLDKDSRITLIHTSAYDTADFSLDEVFDLQAGSVRQSIATPTYNRLKYRWSRDYAHDRWDGEDTFDNLTDQAAMGGEIVEAPDLELDFLRDRSQADLVAADTASYYDLDAHRFEGEVDLPATIEDMECGALVSLSHLEGFDLTGRYDDVLFKITDLETDLDNLRYRFKAIRRIQLVPRMGSILTDVRVENAAYTGPYLYGRLMAGAFVRESTRNQVRIPYSTDWGETWDYVNSEAVDDAILAFCSIQDPLNINLIHIVTQEDGSASGRVAYWRFNLTSKAFEIENETIVATTNIGQTPIHKYASTLVEGCEVSVADNGTVAVWFHDAAEYYDPADDTYELEEDAPGDYWFGHIYASKRTVGGWSTPIRADWNATDRCVSLSSKIGTVWPGTNARLHLFFAGYPGDSVAATADLYSSTFHTGAGSVSTNGRMVRTSLVFYPSSFTFGRSATDDDGNGRLMHKGFNGKIYHWVIVENELVGGAYDVGALQNEYLMEYYLINSVVYRSDSMAERAQCHTFWVGGEEQRVISNSSAALPTWNESERAGYQGGSQHFDALVFQYYAKKYIASFAGSTPAAIDFQLYAENDLPTSGYDRAAWLAEFGL